VAVKSGTGFATFAFIPKFAGGQHEFHR